MKKISVNDLVNFRSKSDRTKKTFVEKIKSNKIETPTKSGGDYWTSSFSAICKSYSEDDLDPIDEKIQELKDKLSTTMRKITKDMYGRNIDVLQKYKGMKFEKIRPSEKLLSLKKSTGKSLLKIDGLDIQTRPSHLYTFDIANKEKVGAIWFIIRKEGYSIEEVGMFCDMLYRFLQHNYSTKYQILPEFCIAVDLFNGSIVNYSEIRDGGITQILTSTLDEINKLM